MARKKLDLEMKFEKAAFDPAAKILELIPQLDAERQVMICLKLLEFLHPRFKPQDPETDLFNFEL